VVSARDVNEWIRTSGAFDATIDFDRLLKDPENPGHLLPRYDGGDHLHPGDDGNRAMADAVDLEALLDR
jgi:lysophospholipase L1-like esterase